jgi:hypothetical protein
MEQERKAAHEGGPRGRETDERIAQGDGECKQRTSTGGDESSSPVSHGPRQAGSFFLLQTLGCF